MLNHNYKDSKLNLNKIVVHFPFEWYRDEEVAGKWNVYGEVYSAGKGKSSSRFRRTHSGAQMLYVEAHRATFERFRTTLYFKLLYLKHFRTTSLCQCTTQQVRRTTLQPLILYLQGFRTTFSLVMLYSRHHRTTFLLFRTTLRCLEVL